MTTPGWALLAFAVWTLVLLLTTVGVYRWRRILTGRVEIRAFRHDALSEHEDWYRRSMRAHANCVENLPVYAAIVVALHILRLDTGLLDALAGTLIVCRICQTLVHVLFTETNRTVSIRFGFFALQVFVMLWMAGVAVGHGLDAGT